MLKGNTRMNVDLCEQGKMNCRRQNEKVWYDRTLWKRRLAQACKYGRA